MEFKEKLVKLFDEILSCFKKEAKKDLAVDYNEIRKLVQSLKEDIEKRVVPALGEGEEDVSRYRKLEGALRNLRNVMEGLIETSTEYDKLQKTFSIDPKMGEIREQIAKAQQREIERRTVIEQEVLGKSSEELEKDMENKVLELENKMRELNIGRVKFLDYFYEALEMVKMKSPSLTIKKLVIGINKVCEIVENPSLNDPEIIAQVIALGVGKEEYVQRALERGEEVIAPPSKKVPMKEWEKIHSSIDVDELFEKLAFIGDPGEKLRRVWTWLKSKISGFMAWLGGLIGGVEDVTNRYETAASQLKGFISSFDATASVEKTGKRFASDMRKAKKEKKIGKIAKRLGNEMKGLKKWRVVLIDKGKQIDKYITMGRASNKFDVIQQLKREGIGGEIVSIQDVTEWQMAGLKRKSMNISNLKKMNSQIENLMENIYHNGYYFDMGGLTDETQKILNRKVVDGELIKSRALWPWIHSGTIEKTIYVIDEKVLGSKKKGEVSELTTQQEAENAIQDMFLSKQYQGKVPKKDIEHILTSERWADMYGKEELESAWNSFVDEEYVMEENDFWIWQNAAYSEFSDEDRTLASGNINAYIKETIPGYFGFFNMEGWCIVEANEDLMKNKLNIVLNDERYTDVNLLMDDVKKQGTIYIHIDPGKIKYF